MKIRFFLTVALALSACAAPVSTADAPSEPVDASSQVIEENTPAPHPDTPSPPEIDAPIVESPALVTVHFLNELDGWGKTETQIVRTNDGGITWYNVTPPNVTETGYSVEFFVLDNNHVWMQKPDFNNYPNSGFLNITSDGGRTWRTITVPFSGAHIHFLDADSGWALADRGVGAGSNAVAVYQTNDGGVTWVQTYTNDPDQADAGDSLPLGGLKMGITPLNMQTAWIYGVVYAPGSAYVFRTDDGGHVWKPVSLSLPEGVDNAELTVEQISIVSANESFLLIRITSDQTRLAVYDSNDAGQTWSLTSTLIPGAGAAKFLSAEEAVIYNGEQFYVTRDAARTWSIIPPDMLFSETFVAMDFVNPLSGWVTTLDPTGHRSFLRTTDGGATWSAIIP